VKLRSLRGLLAAATVLGLASLARADAPPDQYGLFDASYVVIEDDQTGLDWQRYPSTTTMSFTDAAAYCAGLSLQPYTSGWRVPSYKELLTLVNETPDYQYENASATEVAIDANAFPQTQAVPYWTSSLFAGQGGGAYTVDFGTGVGNAQSTDAQSTPALVRCVH
jgi:Protein of unknown function (DUF1566)